MKFQLLHGIAKIVKNAADTGVGRRCLSDWHQPKVPTLLRSEKKKER